MQAPKIQEGAKFTSLVYYCNYLKQVKLKQQIKIMNYACL